MQQSKSSFKFFVFLLFSCRDYQAIFDNCVEQNLGQTKPEILHFMKIRLHKTDRPRPPPTELPEPLPEADVNAEPRAKFYNQHGFSR